MSAIYINTQSQSWLMPKAFMIFLATHPVALPPMANVQRIRISCPLLTFHFCCNPSNIRLLLNNASQKSTKKNQLKLLIPHMLNFKAGFTDL
jgi:hypothetical protein